MVSWDEGGAAPAAVELKNEVIWRWEGSLAAPANWRLVRGADIVWSGVDSDLGGGPRYVEGEMILYVKSRETISDR